MGGRERAELLLVRVELVVARKPVRWIGVVSVGTEFSSSSSSSQTPAALVQVMLGRRVELLMGVVVGVVGMGVGVVGVRVRGEQLSSGWGHAGRLGEAPPGPEPAGIQPRGQEGGRQGSDPSALTRPCLHHALRPFRRRPPAPAPGSTSWVTRSRGGRGGPEAVGA